jgi:prophage regulatory protein
LNKVKTRFIRLPEVLARTGLSPATIYRQIKVGRFPAQVTLGIRAVGWIESEIDDWIEARILAARGKS